MQRINNCVSNRRQMCALTFAFLLAAVFVPFAKANDGILDYNFGEGGKISTYLDTAYEENNQMVTQPDGKIIALFVRWLPDVGSGSTASGFALVRYNPDGTLDNSFGTNGIQRAGLEIVGVEGGYASAIALQTDGKIVVAGSGRNANNLSTGYNFAVGRFNANGTVDTSFGTGGLVNTAFPQGNCQPASYCNSDGANALIIQPDGKILVAGFATPSVGFQQMALARYNVNGSFDTGNDGDPNINFGTNGTRLVEGVFTQESAVAMVLTSASSQFGNDILVSARYRNIFVPNPSAGFFFIRFNGAGSTITGVGSNGRSFVSFPNNVVPTEVRNLIPDSNGNLLFLGTASDASTSYDVIAAFNTLGTLNPTYGNGGAILTPLDSNSPSYYDDAIQSDGKIVTVGSILGGDNGYLSCNTLARRNDVFLTRRNADGSLDMSFGNRGQTVSNFGAEDGARSVVLLPNQRIFVGGTSNFAGLESYVRTPALFRYIPETPSDRYVDLSFGGDGRVTTDFCNGLNDWGFGGTVQPDGKIIAVGEVVLTSTNSAFGITRYNSNGSVDMRTTVDVSPNFDIARIPTVQSDGKIIVVGVSLLPSGDVNRAIVRLNANGTPDTSFGTNGIVTIPVGPLTTFRSDVRVQPDGKIIVAGTIRPSTTSNSYSVVRLNSDGTFDTSFGIGGQVVTAFENGTNAFVGGAALQTDNKIVVAGGPTSGTLTIARYNSNGTLDTSFDGDGKVISTIGTNAQATSVVIQPDGKIVVSGSASNAFMVVRYNSNGSFDTSFNGVGFVITHFGTTDVATGLVLQNNKIIATGYTITGTNTAFAVAKYNDNGSIDMAFGDNGKITTDFTSGEDISFGSALQPDGNLVLFGRTVYSSPLGRDFAIARYGTTVPTAAGVTVSGRVVDSLGNGVSRASVTITGQNGATRTVITGSLGYFQIEDVLAGETYIVSVRHKRYQFEPRVVSVNDNIGDLDFAASPPGEFK